jgi:tetratricopeptide (TPR) repeat protein
MRIRQTFRLALMCITLSFTVSHTALADTPSAQPAPETGLTSDFVYKYLIGEFAGQRGDVGLASKLFLDLAKSSRDPRLAERAAKAAVYGHEPAVALQATDLWAELDPNSIEAQQASTQLLIAAGKIAEAKPHLKKLLEKEDTRANGFLYLNSLLAKHPDKEEILQLVQELAASYPNLAEAHFTIAHSAWSAGKDELALSELETAENYNPAGRLPPCCMARFCSPNRLAIPWLSTASSWSATPKPTKCA